MDAQIQTLIIDGQQEAACMAYFNVFTLDGEHGKKVCSGFSLEKVRELSGECSTVIPPPRRACRVEESGRRENGTCTFRQLTLLHCTPRS